MVRCSVTEMGVDGGSDYVFAIEPGNPCQVTEYSQSWTANFGGHQSDVSITDCRQLAVPEGVAMRCGGELLLIPATVGIGHPPRI